MTIKNLLRGASVVVLLTASVAMATTTLAASKPLNAGKTGLKSNAGGGNGTEDYQVSAPTTTTTTQVVETETIDVVTGEPIVVSETTTTTETGRVQVGDPERVGQSANFKINYLVTYETVTTVGTETTVTTNTFLTSDTYKTTTTTTDMGDRDPGRSQERNKAPEGEPDDIVETETVLEDSTTDLIDTDVEVIEESTDSEAIVSEEDKSVTCNSGVGGNPGANFCN